MQWTETALRPKVSRLSGAAHGTFSVVASMAGWAFLTTVSAFIALDYFTVHELFAFVLPAIAVFSATVVALLHVRARKLKKRPRPRARITRRQMVLFSILFAVLLGISVGIAAARTRADARLLARSSRYFSVEVAGNIAQDRIDNTLIELTRQMVALEEKWLPNRRQLIRVVIFSNLSSFLEATGRPSWSGGATFNGPGGPVILLPAENDGNQWTGVSPTSTPAHEVVHAVMNMALGSEVAGDLPLWFEEGVAEYESLKGTRNLPSRASNRVILWLLRSELPETQGFLSYVPGDSESEVAIFYSTSFEVVRFIVATRGEGALTSVFNLTKQGVSFADALMSVTGYSQEQVYERWKAS